LNTGGESHYQAMADQPILYCGDTSLGGAAAYLAGLMTAFQFGFDYIPGDRPLNVSQIGQLRKLFILSDYASKMMSPEAQAAMLKQVRAGAGLLMIGGWESFHGHGGDWDGTPVGDALPVEISREDDRINCDQPALLLRMEDHDVVADLPWNTRPPTVGGFNRVVARPGSATILLVQRFAVTLNAGLFDFNPKSQDPMLVLGTHGAGHTAALATDLAPHWVGGLVDWGDGERVKAQAPGSWEIEVGNLYSQFILNLLAWAGQFPRRQV
jgi:uncharacterized membrane protein